MIADASYGRASTNHYPRSSQNLLRLFVAAVVTAKRMQRSSLDALVTIYCGGYAEHLKEDAENDLAQSSLAQSPLFVLAVMISAGITLAHYSPYQSKSVLFASSLRLQSHFFRWRILIQDKKVLQRFLIAAFFCAGLVLSLVDTSAATNRMAKMYDGLFSFGDQLSYSVLSGHPSRRRTVSISLSELKRSASKGLSATQVGRFSCSHTCMMSKCGSSMKR